MLIPSVSCIKADKDLLPDLLTLEQQCFSSDRLSKRSFKHWLKHKEAILLVARLDNVSVGYGLVLCNRGTSLARLYSLAVSPDYQGRGIARTLLTELENESRQVGRLFMRLEVAKKNSPAIALYKKLGYQEFGEYHNYYDDHDDALRMQKSIWQGRVLQPAQNLNWYAQTTDFTCGPAALLMAMSYDDEQIPVSVEEELAIWRTATTIFMTSGHGGTHPFGLALAAAQRGFDALVKVNTTQPLFVDGVRSAHKKEVMVRVHNALEQDARTAGVTIDYTPPSQEWIVEQIELGAHVLVLISTYQLDRRKAPHWVAVTHCDEHFIYVHDPDVGEHQMPIDCQHVPIARDKFDSMATFGKDKLRTAISVRKLRQ